MITELKNGVDTEESVSMDLIYLFILNKSLQERVKALRIHYEADKEKLQKIKALLVGVAIINQWVSVITYTLVGRAVLIALVGVPIFINYISGCGYFN